MSMCTEMGLLIKVTVLSLEFEQKSIIFQKKSFKGNDLGIKSIRFQYSCFRQYKKRCGIVANETISSKETK